MTENAGSALPDSEEKTIAAMTMLSNPQCGDLFGAYR